MERPLAAAPAVASEEYVELEQRPEPPRGLLPLRLLSLAAERLRVFRLERRWRYLRSLGMQIGRMVNLPASTWIDTSHANLISIGDYCGFGDGCLILAHDAMSNEYLDATRVGRVIIHSSCHFGARTVILPGVEIGPRTVVGAGSVITKSLPPETVAGGNPARVICTLDEYLERHRERLRTAPKFRYAHAHLGRMTPEAQAKMREVLAATDGYVLGGLSAALEGSSFQHFTALGE